ncbi:MAG: NAD(P)H-binding protein [Chloroflexi bacterium]|nr:NAD(P)H-binding protein [Chloroflexota bacterium]
MGRSLPGPSPRGGRGLTERILLIGATGFLGSFVAARLSDRPLSVLARTTSDVSVLPPGVEVRAGQLEDPLPLADVTSVVYCASMGFGHIPSVVQQLESAGVKRAVFISTTAIFTSLPSRSRAVRVHAESVVNNSSLDWTILRPTMIYGTARDRNVSRLLRLLKRSPVFPLCSNALWQPIYVEDLAGAVVSSLDSDASISRTYNLAGACALRFAELVRTAAHVLSRRVLLVPVPLSAAVVAARLTRVVTPEQVRRLAEDKAFDYAPAAQDLGFKPRSFAEGVHLEARALGLL